MNKRNKIVYTSAIIAFTLKIGMELIFRNGDIVWPAIGMMWCITAWNNGIRNQIMIRIKRVTKSEKRYSRRMGILNCKVTRIYKTLFGVPIKQLHAYRGTYYGETKSLSECNLYR